MLHSDFRVIAKGQALKFKPLAKPEKASHFQLFKNEIFLANWQKSMRCTNGISIVEDNHPLVQIVKWGRGNGSVTQREASVATSLFMWLATPEGMEHAAKTDLSWFGGIPVDKAIPEQLRRPEGGDGVVAYGMSTWLRSDAGSSCLIGCRLDMEKAAKQLSIQFAVPKHGL